MQPDEDHYDAKVYARNAEEPAARLRIGRLRTAPKTQDDERDSAIGG